MVWRISNDLRYHTLKQAIFQKVQFIYTKTVLANNNILKMVFSYMMFKILQRILNVLKDFNRCIVWSSQIYGFWLALWCIKSLIKQMLQYSLKAEFTESAYRVLRQ